MLSFKSTQQSIGIKNCNLIKKKPIYLVKIEKKKLLERLSGVGPEIHVLTEECLVMDGSYFVSKLLTLLINFD